MPHERRPQEEEIGRNLPKPQIDPESPTGGAISTLKSALGSIAGTVFEAPGIKQAITATEAVSTRAYGTISSEVAAHKGVVEEAGWGGWAKSFLNPFDEDLVRAKHEEIVGLDGDDGFWDTLSKTADWQRNRKSAFFGEKFIGEMLFDPLNFIPVGVAAKVIGRAGRVARRTPTQKAAMKRTKLGNIQDPKSIMDEKGNFADAAGKAPGTSTGFDDNLVRKIATTVYKRALKTPFGLLAFPFKLINPSGVLRIGTKNVADKAEIRTYIYARQLEEANGVIAGDLANMRLQEMDNVFDVTTKQIAGKDQVILNNVTRKPGVVSETDDILMGDVLEFPDNYVVSTAQRELIDEGHRVIEGYKQVLLDAGIPLEEAALGPGQHYWPRFVDMYTEFQAGTIARKGAAIGIEPSIMKQRFWDEFGEGVINGVPYATKHSSMPLSDVMQAYMNMTMKQVIDVAYMDDLVKITGKTVNLMDVRKLKAKGEGSFHFNIANGRQQVAIIRRAVSAIDEWQATGKPPNVAILDELDTLVPDSKDLSKELRNIIDPYTTNAAGARVYRANPARLAKDKVSRVQLRRETRAQQQVTQRLALYKGKLKRLEGEVNTTLKQVRADRLEVKNRVNRQKQAKGLKAFPEKMFAEPEFNAQLFPAAVVDRIMPKLATREQLLQNKRFLSEAIGKAAGFGRVARAFQLTYDLGVQFLQGATVAAASPTKWLTATRKMLNSWNNPQKHMEYLSDPQTQQVLQVFQGRIHIGSSEFTEALRAGGAVNRVIGRVQPLARATEKFRTSFDAFGDVARIEMAKSFLPAVRAGKITADQVANHVNKMTGISSSRKLGIGATQREIESAAISLAPNYLRATVGLLADAAQIITSPNRFESQQALFALTKFFGGTVLAYVGICEALGQEPKLNPRSTKEGGDGGGFMTVVVDGQRVGLGTKPYAIMRKVTASIMALEEGNVSEAGMYLKNFFRGQTAPMTSTMWDNIRGETAIGEPIQTAQQRVGNLSSRLLPFWAEAAINDDPGPSAFGTAADFVGLRSGPLSYSAMRYEVRDELAARFPRELLTPDQKRFMAEEFIDEPTWEMLSKVQKGQIERGDLGSLNRAKVRELQRFDEVIKDRAKKIGDPKRVAYLQDLDDAKSRLEIETEKLQILYEEGEVSTYQFRKTIAFVNAIYGSDMEKIHAKDGVHEEYFQEQAREREERQKRGKFEPIEDKARQEYIDYIVASPDLDNYRGIEGYNFRERERREEQLRQKYGNDIINKIKRDFLLNKKVGLLYKQLQIDKENLSPYWDIQNNYVDRKPILRSLLEQINRAENAGDMERIQQIKATSRYRAMNIDTRRDKRELLISRPRLDALLRFWGYTSTLQTVEAELIYKELIRNAKAGILRE